MSAEATSGESGFNGLDLQWLELSYPNLDASIAVLNYGETELQDSQIGRTALGLATELTEIESGFGQAILDGCNPDEIDDLQDRHQHVANQQLVFSGIYTSIEKRLNEVGEAAMIQPELYEDVVEDACQETLEAIQLWGLVPSEEDTLRAMVFEVSMYYRLFELKSHFLKLRNPPLTTKDDFDAMFEGYELPPDDWVTLKLDELFPKLNPNGETARHIIAKRKESEEALADREAKKSDNNVYSSQREHEDFKEARDRSEYILEQIIIMKAMYAHITAELNDNAALKFSDKRLEEAKQISLIHIARHKQSGRFSREQRDAMKRIVRQMELSYLFDRYNDIQKSSETTQPEQ